MTTNIQIRETLSYHQDPLAYLEGVTAKNPAVADLPIHQNGKTARLLNEPELIAALLRSKDFERWNHLAGIAESVGHGLLTNAEPLHGKVRKAVQPAFHRRAVDSWEPMIETMAQQAVCRELQEGEAELHVFFDRLTLRIAGRVLFDLDLDDVLDPMLSCIKRLQAWHQKKDRAPRAAKLFYDASAELDDLLQTLIKDQPVARREGLVFRVMDADSELSAEQKHQEFRTMLIAASVTTGVILSGACIEMAKLGTCPEEESGIDQILLESMRLNPPVWWIPRIAKTSGLLAGRLSYDAGDPFVVSPWVLHRRADSFPEPQLFRPDRWATGLEKKLPKGSFIPFSLGSRSCIGNHFARLEARVILRVLLGRFTIKIAPDRPGLEWLPRLTLTSAEGAWVTLVERNQNTSI